MEVATGNVLGIKINPIDIDRVLRFVDNWIVDKRSQYICAVPVHSIMDCLQRSDLIKLFNDSGLSTPDGFGVVWALRLKGYSSVQRVCGTDLLLAICHHGLPRGYRHYFFGGKPRITENLVDVLEHRFPGIQIAGTYSPPFHGLSSAEDQEIVENINKIHPDIIWVGMGSPKQEIWMHDHLEKIHTSVMVGVGAAFDFVSGAKRRAPLWIQKIGMEWLFRFFLEPSRLWPRYRQYPHFVKLLFLELIGIKTFRQ